MVAKNHMVQQDTVQASKGGQESAIQSGMLFMIKINDEQGMIILCVQ